MRWSIQKYLNPGAALPYQRQQPAGAGQGVLVNQQRVLRPYVSQKRLWVGWRVLLVGLLLFVAAFYGLMTAILPLWMLVVPVTPLLILTALCLWLLPDAGGFYEATYVRLAYWLVAVNILWPPYIALSLTGLPWLSPLRVLTALLVSAFVFNYATSSEMRRTVADSINGVPIINRLFWAFWLLTTLTLALSSQLSFSIGKYANNQIYWTLFFMIGAVVARRPGMVSRAGAILVFATLMVLPAALYEFRVQRVPWVEYVPGWLWGDEELITDLLDSGARAGTDMYRVRGTTTNSLYFAEYLAIVFPLVVHAFAISKGLLKQLVLLAGVVGMMIVMYLTGARSGVVGILLTFVLYLALAALRKRSENPVSLVATATLAAYPAILALVAGLVLFWRRARVMVLGGGQHQASTDARGMQWEMGWRILQGNPVGHGASRSGEVLGWTAPDGSMTIDSYYLSVMLDYGVIALPIFCAMFALPIWYAWKSTQRPQLPDVQMMVPLAIGLFNFVVIKGVLSSESNMPLTFLFLGFVVALVARQRADEALPAAAQGRGLPVPVQA